GISGFKVRSGPAPPGTGYGQPGVGSSNHAGAGQGTQRAATRPLEQGPVERFGVSSLDGLGARDTGRKPLPVGRLLTSASAAHQCRTAVPGESPCPNRPAGDHDPGWPVTAATTSPIGPTDIAKSSNDADTANCSAATRTIE